MTLIFLDIDGVLNCKDTSERCGGALGIDPQKVQHLKYIVEMTNAQIILTSTWKLYWNPFLIHEQSPIGAYLEKQLADAGLTITNKTYDNWDDRGQGIIDYLHEHPADAWIVLDDEIFDDYEELGICPHLIHTDFNDSGLTHELAEQAVNMVQEQLEENLWQSL